jgi:membrane-bound serine protease (ClpP class)
MTGKVWTALILVLCGIFVLFLELFVPSAGLLLVVGVLCVGGSLVAAFSDGFATGMVFLVAECVLTPILAWLAFQLWKHSPIGRRMFFEAGDSSGQNESTNVSDEPMAAPVAVGQVGRTLTPLRPAGMTDFSGRRVDTVSEGVMIEPGERVQVVEVQGNRVVVRRVSSEDFDHAESSV